MPRSNETHFQHRLMPFNSIYWSHGISPDYTGSRKFLKPGRKKYCTYGYEEFIDRLRQGDPEQGRVSLNTHGEFPTGNEQYEILKKSEAYQLGHAEQWIVDDYNIVEKYRRNVVLDECTGTGEKVKADLQEHFRRYCVQHGMTPFSVSQLIGPKRLQCEFDCFCEFHKCQSSVFSQIPWYNSET